MPRKPGSAGATKGAPRARKVAKKLGGTYSAKTGKASFKGLAAGGARKTARRKFKAAVGRKVTGSSSSTQKRAGSPIKRPSTSVGSRPRRG